MGVGVHGRRSPSAPEAVSDAFRWTGSLLFQPVNVASWLALAVCAFLAQLSDWPTSLVQLEHRLSEDSLTPWSPWRALAEWDLPTWEELAQALARGLATVWLVALLLTLLLMLGLLFAWISARGELMFLDGVVRGRGRILEPWSRLRRPANALFCARVVLVLALFATTVTLLISLLASTARHGEVVLGHAVLAGISLLVAIVGCVIAERLLTDFVAPALYLRDQGVIDAIGAMWRDLIVPHAPSVIVFYVLRLALFVVASVAMVAISCVTCCVAALPLISAVVFLPIHAFFRAYSAFFVDQLSGPYRLFPGATGEPPDLTGPSDDPGTPPGTAPGNADAPPDRP